MALDFDLKRDTFLAFTTPIAKMRVPEAADINPAVRRAILEREAAEPGQSRSDLGGWHSRDDFLSWPQPEIAVLRDAFVEAVNAMVAFTARAQSFTGEQSLRASANVCRRGNYHKLHNHPTYHWSGVYYVEAGTPAAGNPHSATLEFQDPRGFVDMMDMPGTPFGRTLSVPPESGQIVIFPSWLHHWVNPYEGDGERISIAFNSRLSDFKKTG